MLPLNFVDLKCVHKSTFAFHHSLLDEASLKFSDDKHALPDWPWLYPQLLKSIPNIVMMTDQQPVALSFFHNCFFWVTVEGGGEFNLYSWPGRKLSVIFTPSRPYVVILVVFGSQNRVKPKETTTLTHFNAEQPAVDVYLYSAAPALEIWSFQSWGRGGQCNQFWPDWPRAKRKESFTWALALILAIPHRAHYCKLCMQ